MDARRKHRALPSDFLPVGSLSLLLSLAFSICVADTLIPFFGARRPAIRYGFLIAASIVVVALMLPAIRRFVRRVSKATTRGNRLAWSMIFVPLLISAILVIVSAWNHQASMPPVEIIQAGHGPGYPLPNYAVEVAFAFSLMTFLFMVHSDLVAAVLDAGQKLHFALGFVAVCFVGIYVVNNLLPAIDTGYNLWRLNFNLPHSYEAMPLGMDFREGVYRPAQRLVSGEPVYPATVYPPFATILGLPYLLLPENAAYALHLLVLVFANLLTLFLTTVLTRSAVDNGAGPAAHNTMLIQFVLLLLLGFNLLSSYPFRFSIDRGNIDILAMLLALVSIVIPMRSRRQIWIPVLLLSMAVHIKFYPILLFPLLLYLRGWKIVLPAFLVNAFLLLILGPQNALEFLKALQLQYRPELATSNHSGVAFASVLATDVPGLGPSVPRLQPLFSLLPVVICGVGWWAASRFRSKKQAVVAMLMLSTPLMNVIAGISYDYQLVILSSAILIMLSRMLTNMYSRQMLWDYVQILLVAGVMVAIGRSDSMMDSWPAFLQNKYPWIILLQLLMLGQMCEQATRERRLQAPGRAATPALLAPGS